MAVAATLRSTPTTRTSVTREALQLANTTSVTGGDTPSRPWHQCVQGPRTAPTFRSAAMLRHRPADHEPVPSVLRCLR
jgi:hypothetical protein